MRIGIIGSGIVATTLAEGLAAKGHSVKLGTREPAKLASFIAGHPGIEAVSAEDAALHAELAVLAVKGTAAEAALRPAAQALAGKVVVDANNPIADEPPEQGVLRFFTGPNDSLGERLQKAYPALRIVKAFNSVGSAFMIDPSFPGGTPSMFIAGDDPQAKAAVASLLESVGWDPVDMGGIVASRAIEPLCQLWCIPGLLRGQWEHAFSLLRR